jgi:hypothetical protein
MDEIQTISAQYRTAKLSIQNIHCGGTYSTKTTLEAPIKTHYQPPSPNLAGKVTKVPLYMLNNPGIEALSELNEIIQKMLPDLVFCPQISVFFSILLNFVNKPEAVQVLSFLHEKSKDFDSEFNSIGEEPHPIFRLYLPSDKQEMAQ